MLDMWLRALHLSDDYHLAPPPRIATPLSASVTSSRPATPFGYRPGSARSGAGTQSGFSGGSLGGAGSPTGSIGAPVAGAVFHSDGWELARHGSRALALCCCNEGVRRTFVSLTAVTADRHSCLMPCCFRVLHVSIQ